ncbi:uncharacterized protein LOC125701161 [Lagopus muta]|uniref:uncharacterized protein LOC125701161 n=1 Tax=Lagopus muta TaxID=64668 RepID=UPI00209D68B2|nr:uncharacterized protein LOC125701161 [Lagopus muta]
MPVSTQFKHGLPVSREDTELHNHCHSTEGQTLICLPAELSKPRWEETKRNNELKDLIWTFRGSHRLMDLCTCYGFLQCIRLCGAVITADGCAGLCALLRCTEDLLSGKHCGQPEVLGQTVGVKCMKSNTPCYIPEVRPRVPSDPKHKCSNCFPPRKPSKACFWKTQSRGRMRWENKVSLMDTKLCESTSDVSAYGHRGLAQLQGPAVAAQGAGPCLTPLCFTCCSPLG